MSSRPGASATSSGARFLRFAPWSVVLLLALLTSNMLPSAFAQGGTSAADAIPVGTDGRFTGTTAPSKSTWLRFNYNGGSATATVSVTYEPTDSSQTDIFLYTGDAGNLRQESASVTRTNNTLAMNFSDPSARTAFLEVRNSHTDRTISFAGAVSPATTIATPTPTTTPPTTPVTTPTPGPTADSAQTALTVGADGRFAGTIGPRRAVWYRFWYGNPGADAQVRTSFAPNADSVQLNIYTGADPTSLTQQSGDSSRSGDQLSRRVNLSTAQWVYFVVANNNDAVNVAYGGDVNPAFPPPGSPTAVPTGTAGPATATPVAAPTSTPQPAPALTRDERYFAQTGFRVERDEIWSYFQARGRIETFGYPVSRTFTLDGCQVQMFQRLIAQLCPGRNSVSLINMLDPEIFPYTKVNGSTFPAPDTALKESTPNVSDPNYGTAILAFVRANAPDTFESNQVNFGQTFFGLITSSMANTSDPNILGLINLEIWGAPISRPQREPTNNDFVYERFQRGIMHHIASQGLTRGILLADYLKAIIRNRDIPGDLGQQAASEAAQGTRAGRYYAQYCPGASNWVCRPEVLPPAQNNLTWAFEQG